MALVTISHNLGSRGADIARLTAAGLDVPLYDDRQMQAIALASGIHPDDLGGLDEKAPGFFDRVLSRRPDVYLDYMESVVYEMARRGSGVIVGHGSQMLLRDFDCALHVRVHARETLRAERIAQAQGIGKADARKLIAKADARQQGFFNFAFQKRWDDAALYDLVVNTGKLADAAAAAVIAAAANDQYVSECSLTALESMERLALVKRIEAELLKHEIDLQFLTIDIRDEARADISGLVFAPETVGAIAEIVRHVPGVRHVDSRVALMPPGV
ncbi:MAG: cytidylate kinase-like family protein [Desulfobacterales bacterium]|nr:cytidylate kinase-like family protein [Desulfobacterales bacterium]